jgi:flagellar protein FliO/FliZ
VVVPPPAPLAAAPLVPMPPPLPAVVAAPAPEKKSGPTLLLPGLVLVAIAGAAVYLRRRKAANPGLIQILESASLGPKRSLIIARVNGEVMILGSSEAGITFLGAPRAGGDQGLAQAPVEMAPLEEQPSRPLDEGGLLARLFGKREQPTEDAPSQMDWKDFDDLLAESREDQDLRRKLASGLGSKVS